jgi:hypothetical protein
MDKKADLSLNTIVVAAIVLIVLVVLVVIFAGRMSVFRIGLNTCDGTCEKTASECQGENKMPIYTINCRTSSQNSGEKSTGNYCCVTRDEKQ